MAININTYLIQRNVALPRKGTIAVYLENAVITTGEGTTQKPYIAAEVQSPIFLGSVNDLYTNFRKAVGVNDLAGAIKELVIMEYLLKNRVPVFAIPKNTDLETTLESLENINEVFDSILTPSIEVTAGDTVATKLAGDALEVSNYVSDKDIKYYIELDLEDVGKIEKLKAKELVANHKVELAYGKFYPLFASAYTSDLSEFLMPASALLASKKSQRIIADTPWIPVAGEANGIHEEVLRLQYSISEAQKNILQAYGANVLGLKRGVGHFFMTQNTLVADRSTNKQNYLIRSHIVSLVLHINEQVRNIANKFQFVPNNSKTWTSLSAKLEGLLDSLIAKDAVESRKVFTGTPLMTEADILDGTLRAVIVYKPVGVVENIYIDLYISNEEITLEQIYQGNLKGGVEV